MFTLGVDYGTNSVRALIVRCRDGREFGSAVVNYPSGEQGILLDPSDHNLARQHPGDYIFGLEKSVRLALAAAKKQKGFSADRVVGIGVDTTGSSPIPVDKNNVPLALSAKFKKNLNAQCWLWKDHTSWREAAQITKTASEIRPQYLAKCGDTYSSEWWWAKIWHCLNVAPAVFTAAHSWVEFADWIPSILAGVKNPREVKAGICPAGHKAMYAEDWGGLPDKEFLARLDPKLAELHERLYTKAYDATEPAGHLCAEWAERLGLKVGIPIAIGEFDVHYGAIGSGVTEGTIVKVIGTSTCDCGVVSAQKEIPDIPGICGIVKGAILPGYYGIEAGQSAVGDIFKWWVEVVCQGSAALHLTLTAEAATIRAGESGLLALDWNNGNRSILVDPLLTGALLGTTLHTTRAEIYRALIEATAFGARTIIERLRKYGVPVDRMICAGGIAEKNPLAMQIYADITGCHIFIAGSSQACALGAAISAAVLAGIHPDFPSAQKAMATLKKDSFTPTAGAQQSYNKLYALYRKIHDSFGGLEKSADLSRVMKDLLEIKAEVVGARVASISSSDKKNIRRKIPAAKTDTARVGSIRQSRRSRPA